MTDQSISTEYYSKQAISFLPRVLTTIIAVLTAISIVIYLAVGKEAAMGLLIVFGVFIIVGLLLSKITVKISSGIMALKFGPFRDILAIAEIRTIEIVEIDPLSIYHGYGRRVAEDGSIGYIAAGKKGVRIEMKEDKVFIITLEDPNELLAVIKNIQDHFS